MRKGRNDSNRPRSRTFDRDGRERRKFGGSFQGGQRDWSYSEPRVMHKATCAECNSSCEVPFKPIEGKAVYCRECFRKRRDRF